MRLHVRMDDGNGDADGDSRYSEAGVIGLWQWGSGL